MVHLTEDETLVLRRALGLSHWNRENPTRNFLQQTLVEQYPVQVAALVERDYVKESFSYGPLGRETYYMVTDAGRLAVLEQEWKS